MSGTQAGMPPVLVWRAILVLFVRCTIALDTLPNGVCSVEGQACEIQEDNLVASLTGVPLVGECRFAPMKRTVLTSPILDQKAFSSLISAFCCLLDQFYTHVMTAVLRTCGDNVEGVLGDNVLELLVDVPEEIGCKETCQKSTDCKFYTYHNGSDQTTHQTVHHRSPKCSFQKRHQRGVPNDPL